MAETLAPQTLIVDSRSAGVRLDVFLARHADISRSKLQAAIKAGHATLNGKIVKPNHLVRVGDNVAVTELASALHQQENRDPGLDPVVLDEDDNYLVVIKPSGLVVHGGPGIHEATLVDWLVDHVPNIGEVGDQPDVRPGIVHRLDRDVSGVMVIAKTQSAFESLKRQFQNHSIEKQYQALVQGRVVDQSGSINFAIARSPGRSGLMIARPKSNEGKQAETLFRVERYVKGMTLVHVQTLTGRTHQIRVHFKAIGHPLVGDPLYKIRRLKMEKLPAPRVFLHAERLAFDDLKGNRREFRAPLPPDLQHFLDRAG